MGRCRPSTYAFELMNSPHAPKPVSYCPWPWSVHDVIHRCASTCVNRYDQRTSHTTGSLTCVNVCRRYRFCIHRRPAPSLKMVAPVTSRHWAWVRGTRGTPLTSHCGRGASEQSPCMRSHNCATRNKRPPVSIIAQRDSRLFIKDTFECPCSMFKDQYSRVQQSEPTQ